MCPSIICNKKRKKEKIYIIYTTATNQRKMGSQIPCWPIKLKLIVILVWQIRPVP